MVSKGKAHKPTPVSAGGWYRAVAKTAQVPWEPASAGKASQMCHQGPQGLSVADVQVCSRLGRLQGGRVSFLQGWVEVPHPELYEQYEFGLSYVKIKVEEGGDKVGVDPRKVGGGGEYYQNILCEFLKS